MSTIPFRSNYTAAIHGYSVTNEDPSLLRRAVAENGAERALAIAGGGEQILLGLLPYVRSVHGVDISTTSLAATAVKAEMLRAYGSDIKKVLQNGKYHFCEESRKLTHRLPVALQSSIEMIDRWFLDYPRFERIWIETPSSILRRAQANLDGLTLEQNLLQRCQGKYPFVYTSNAIGYCIPFRTQKEFDSSAFTVNDAIHLVEEGGLIARTDDIRRHIADPKSSITLKTRQTLRGTYSSHYVVFRELHIQQAMGSFEKESDLQNKAQHPSNYPNDAQPHDAGSLSGR